MITPASAETTVEVWENYDVTIAVDDTTALVKEELTIRNVIDKAVVPGYGYIVLSKEESSRIMGVSIPSTENTRGMEIRDVTVRMDDGSLITDVLVTEDEESTTIRYGFWTPVMPGQSRTITIEYKTDDIVEKGILFDHVTYIIQPSSIPIENAKIQADVNGKHVSYSSQTPTDTTDIVTWTSSNLEEGAWQLDFEYGSLPLPNMTVKWTNIMWVLMFGIICFWSYRQWKFEK